MLRPLGTLRPHTATAEPFAPSSTIGTVGIVLVIVVSFLAKLAVIVAGGFCLSFDEAYYWHWSKQLDWCYFSKGPGIAILIRG